MSKIELNEDGFGFGSNEHSNVAIAVSIICQARKRRIKRQPETANHKKSEFDSLFGLCKVEKKNLKLLSNWSLELNCNWMNQNLRWANVLSVASMLATDEDRFHVIRRTEKSVKSRSRNYSFYRSLRFFLLAYFFHLHSKYFSMFKFKIFILAPAKRKYFFFVLFFSTSFSYFIHLFRLLVHFVHLMWTQTDTIK